MSARTATGRFSARRALVLGFGGVLVLVVGLLGWSVLASISGAVIASGLVEVESGNQVVEHIEGGTVSEILVRDGDHVAEGDVLLRFSDARVRSEEAILKAQYAELAARRNRLEAEFLGAEAIVWEDELRAMAAGDPQVQEILDAQVRLFWAREAARAGEVAQLRERIGQAREEIVGLQAQASSLTDQAALIDRELQAQRTLFDKGLTRLDRLMAIERAAENLEGRSGAIAASIARARGKIAELELQILQVDARRIEEAEEQARDSQARENEVKERLASVQGKPRQPGGAGAGLGRGVRAYRVRAAGGGTPRRADPADRAGGCRPRGDGAPQPHRRGPGLSRAGGEAALLGLSRPRDAGVRRPRGAGFGGRGARCGERKSHGTRSSLRWAGRPRTG